MLYVRNNLLPDERIVKQAKIHWSIYLLPIILTLMSLLFIMPMLGTGGVTDDGVGAVTVVLFVLAVFWVHAILTQISTELAVTNKRVIAKTGFISRKTIELNLAKVESLTVNQGIIDRIFNCGTLTVNGTGGVRTPFKAIDDPLAFRRAVNEQTEAIA